MRKLSTCRGAFVFALFLLLPATVSLSAAAQGDDMARAKDAFTRGQTLYDSGEYEEAAAAFQESFDAFPHFRTIFNLALCHEKLEDIPAAVEMYERYLDWSEEVPARGEVEEKLAELRALLPPAPEPEPEPGDGEEERPEPGPDLRASGWITLGVGAAGVITGGVMLGLAASKKSEVEGVDGEPYDPDVHDAMIDDGERYERVGWIVGGIGLTAAAVGVVMLVISDKPEEEAGDEGGEATTVQVGLSPVRGDGALFSAGWRF